MTDLAIYGAGGFGRETALMVAQINQLKEIWNVLGFYDDGIAKGEVVDGLSVLGGISEVNASTDSFALAVAVADPNVRRDIVSKIVNSKVHFPVLAHPTALPGSESNYFGQGSIITAGCILTTGIVLGEFSIINLLTTLGHDVKIGSFCTVMPGCNISGNVQIGECTMVGTGVRILQNLSIGKNCRLGAGAVLTKSFDDGLTVVGIPGKEL